MRERRARAIAAAAVVVLAAVAVFVLRPEPAPVPAALAVIDDDGRFTTALEASDAFAEVSVKLASEDCDVERSARCARIQRASAWAQVTAVLIAGCPPAAVLAARAGLGDYLRGDSDLPPTPRCGSRR